MHLNPIYENKDATLKKRDAGFYAFTVSSLEKFSQITSQEYIRIILKATLILPRQGKCFSTEKTTTILLHSYCLGKGDTLYRL